MRRTRAQIQADKLSDRENAKASREFWHMISLSADPARNKPDWMHAGINLNPRNFNTFRSDDPMFNKKV